MKCGFCKKDIVDPETPVEVGSIDGEYFVHPSCVANAEDLETRRSREYIKGRDAYDRWVKRPGL